MTRGIGHGAEATGLESEAPEPGGRRARRPVPPARTVWIDGLLRRGDEATLSAFDRGARDGEGLLETFRVHGGRPFLWERHLERLVVSAAELGFPVPPSPSTLRQGLEAVLDAERLENAVARITVTRGIPGGRPSRAGCWIEAEPVAGRLWRGTRAGAASVVISARPFMPGPLAGHKTTSRLAYNLARDEARAAGADEALLLTRQGRLLEGSVSNVFVVVDGTLATPSLAAGLLPGITRSFVLTACGDLGVRVRASSIRRDELFEAEEVFLTNAVQGIVPVASIEGHPVPGRALGSKLSEAYRAVTEGGEADWDTWRSGRSRGA